MQRASKGTTWVAYEAFHESPAGNPAACGGVVYSPWFAHTSAAWRTRKHSSHAKRYSRPLRVHVTDFPWKGSAPGMRAARPVADQGRTLAKTRREVLGGGEGGLPIVAAGHGMHGGAAGVELGGARHGHARHGSYTFPRWRPWPDSFHGTHAQLHGALRRSICWRSEGSFDAGFRLKAPFRGYFPKEYPLFFQTRIAP